MRTQSAAPVSGITGGGYIDWGNAGIVSIRPQVSIIESLSAASLRDKCRRVGRYLRPIVTPLDSIQS